MSDKPLLLAAEWYDDCQGKKDYDGSIIAITTRYWPGLLDGEGHMVINRSTGEVFKNVPYGADASAKSELIIRRAYDDDHGSAVTLASKDFSHKDGAIVRAQVEAWAQEKMDRVVEILQEVFNDNEA